MTIIGALLHSEDSACDHLAERHDRARGAIGELCDFGAELVARHGSAEAVPCVQHLAARGLRQTGVLFATAVLLGGSGGCESLPPAKRTVPTLAALDSSQPVASRDGEPVPVLTRAVPKRVRVDGDASEWTNELAAPWVVIAVALDRVYVAAAFTDDDPIALRLADPYDGSLPQLGWTHSSGGFLALDSQTCTHEQVEDYNTGPDWHAGEPHPDEVVTACLALLEAHEAAKTQYRRSFGRRFRLTPQGMSSLDAGATVAPLAQKSGRDGRTLEAALPVSALPRLWHTPLTELEVVALTLDDASVSRLDEAPGQRLPLASPVAFGATADVLAFYLHEPNWTDAPDRHLSFHPGTPNEIRVLRRADRTYGGGATLVDRLELTHPSLEEVTLPLVTPPATPTGPLMAVSDGFTTYLVSLVGSRLAGFARSDHFETLHVIFRDEELHVVAFDPGRHSWHSQGGYDRPAQWVVLALHPDGRLVEVSDPNPGAGWDDFDPSPAFNADFTRLAVRGTDFDGVARTAVWIWNAKTRRYSSSLE
jgi:hypothetical protein